MKKIHIDETKLAPVMEMIEKAASLMEEGKLHEEKSQEGKSFENKSNVKQELANIQKNLRNITGNKKIHIEDFQSYWSYTDLETMARKALMGVPEKTKVTDTQIRNIVLNLLSHREAEMEYWVEFLEVNTGLDNLSDYIFYPDLVGMDGDPSLEEIADRIVADRK